MVAPNVSVPLMFSSANLPPCVIYQQHTVGDNPYLPEPTLMNNPLYQSQNPYQTQNTSQTLYYSEPAIELNPYTNPLPFPSVYHQQPYNENPYDLNSQVIPNPYYTPHHHCTSPIQIPVAPLVSELEPWKVFEERDQMRRIVEDKLELSFYPMDWCVNFESLREILLERYPELEDDLSSPSSPPFGSRIEAIVLQTPPPTPTSMIAPPISPPSLKNLSPLAINPNLDILLVHDALEIGSPRDQFKEDNQEEEYGMEELQQNMADSHHVLASSTVSSQINFQVCSSLQPPISSGSPLQCSLPILPSITTTRHSESIENFIKKTNICYGHNLFDIIPDPNICDPSKLIQAYSSHGTYHHFSMILPPPRPPSQPPDTSLVCKPPQISKRPPIIRPPLPQWLHQFHSKYELNQCLINLSKSGGIDEACHVSDQMLVRDEFSWNTMIGGYASSGRLTEARQLLDEIPNRNLIIWSSLISGCCRHGLENEALKLFWQMRFEGHKPNQYRLGSVRVCSKFSLILGGEQIHGYAIKTQLETNVVVVSTLVNMYAKCGCNERAKEVSDAIMMKDAKAWSSMIVGLAIHFTEYEELELGIRRMADLCGAQAVMLIKPDNGTHDTVFSDEHEHELDNVPFKLRMKMSFLGGNHCPDSSDISSSILGSGSEIESMSPIDVKKEDQACYSQLLQGILSLPSDCFPDKEKDEDVAMEEGQLDYVYKQLPKIFDRYTGAEGFLFLQDNSILNYWSLYCHDNSLDISMHVESSFVDDGSRRTRDISSCCQVVLFFVTFTGAMINFVTEDEFSFYMTSIFGEVVIEMVPTHEDFCGKMFCDETILGKTSISLILKIQDGFCYAGKVVQLLVKLLKMTSVEKSIVLDFQRSVLLPEFPVIRPLASLAAYCKCSMGIIVFVEGIWVKGKSCNSKGEAANTSSHFNAFVEASIDVVEAWTQLTQAPSWSWWLILKASFFKRFHASMVETRECFDGPSLRTSLISRGQE